jgi:Domain of unknown function (DUF4234)
MSDVPPNPDVPPLPSDPRDAPTPPAPSSPPGPADAVPAAPAPPPAPPPPVITYGQVPPTLNEVYYKTGINILLTILTCGIWFCVYAYRTHGDLKRYNGDGLGEVPGLLLGLFISPVVMFTIPNEIEKLYQRDGRESPVKTVWGLWFLLNIFIFIGFIVWYPRVQRALNEFWISKGSQPAA